MARQEYLEENLGSPLPPTSVKGNTLSWRRRQAALPLTSSSAVLDKQRRNSFLTGRWRRRRRIIGSVIGSTFLVLALIWCVASVLLNYIFTHRRYTTSDRDFLKQFPDKKNNNNDANHVREEKKTTPPDQHTATISPTAKMANEMMRTKGVLLRWEEAQTELFDQNGRDYMPAAFVHASMQAPNVMFKWDINNNEFDAGPRVAYLTGSKFEPELLQSSSNNYLEEKVNCRAYFPIDGWSGFRNHRIENNPLGTSCTEYQELNPLSLFNVTNGCSCNYDIVPGKDVVSYFVHNTTTARTKRNFYMSQCWYPGSREGIHHLIDASTAIYQNRKKLWKWRELRKEFSMKPIQIYPGWTECSASPNIQKPSMIDALVVSLPLLPGSNDGGDHYYDNGHVEDLDVQGRDKLKKILDRFAHLNLPVLLLQEKTDIDKKDCQLLWDGLNCEEQGFSKQFLSIEQLEFEDGSCLAVAEGDNEVRYHQAGSSNCTVNKIVHEHYPLWDSYREKSRHTNSKEETQEEKQYGHTTMYYEKRNDTQSLTLILTGDVHGNFFPTLCKDGDEEQNENRSTRNIKCRNNHGAPYVARLVNKIRSVEENVVLLDTGDAFFGGAAGGGRPEMMKLIADAMNLLKYDAMALGNHEPDFGAAALHHLKDMLKFPMVASNVQGPEVAALNIKSHVMIPIGNNGRSHLCVVGVTAFEEYPFVKNLTVTPGTDSVLETLRNLMKNEPSCDRMIVLSHGGIDFDKELSNKLASLSRSRSSDMPVVDAILGGHTHDLFASKTRNDVLDDSSSTPSAGSPLLLHTGAYGRHAGLLRLVWNVTSNALVNAQSEILPLDEDHGVYPDDGHDVLDLVSRKHAIDAASFLLNKQRPVERKIQITRNNAVEDTNRDEELHECGESCRFGDCVLGQIITDAMRFCVEHKHCWNDHAKQHQNNRQTRDEPVIALLESGTVRSCFDPQKQTFDNILPWPNKLVVLRITGDKILKMLQHGLSTKASSTRGGGFLQVSGIKYSFTGGETHQLVEDSVCLDKASVGTENSTSLAIPCTNALDASELYNVVVTDWLAAGGDGFGHLLKDENHVIHESTQTITDALSYYREESEAELEYSTSSQFSRSFLVRTMPSSSDKTRSTSTVAGIAGFLGGAISYILTYPLYALFIRKAASSSWRSSSIQSLSWNKIYDGVWIGAFATALTNGIYFMIYDLNYLADYTNWARSFVAAISNSIVTTPFWVIITWQQAACEKTGTSSTTIETARRLYEARGLFGFFDSLPFNCILCIFPILRQVTNEMILQNGTVGASGSVSAGIAALMASIIATIVTYPIQKTRIVWQVSPDIALNDVRLGLHSTAQCNVTSMWKRFFSGIGYKLADTCLRNFLLFFTMDVIEGLLINTFLS